MDERPLKRKVGRPPKNTQPSSSYYEKFLEYCKAGDVAGIQPFLRRGLNVEQLKSTTGIEPLEYAMENGQLEIFKILFHIYNSQERLLGQVLGHLESKDMTFPMDFQAILKTAHEIVADEQNSSGEPFKNLSQRFCMFNNREKLSRYLRKNPSVTKKQLEILIDICCTFSSQDCLKLLLNHSEVSDSQTKEYFSEEDSVEESSTERIVEKKRRGRPPKNKKIPDNAFNAVSYDDKIEKEGNNFKELFFKACRNGDLNEIKQLAGKGDWNILNHNGNTALFEACLSNSSSVASFLLANGVDANICCGKNLNSPLHIAASKANSELVSLLLAYKADRNYSNEQGLLPEDVAKDQRTLDLLTSNLPENHYTQNAPSKNGDTFSNQKPLVPIDEKLLILSFPDTALTYCLQRQTNRIIKKLGGLRKTTYRSLSFRLCTDEEIDLLDNQPDVHQIILNLDRHGIYVIESGEFLNFIHKEYENRMDFSSFKIEKIPLFLHTHAMPPKMAHKFK